MTQLQGVTDFHALKEEIKLIVQENIDTLLSVGKTVWSILAVNISFLSSIMAAFAGVILGFGMDIVNFLIEIVSSLRSSLTLPKLTHGSETLPQFLYLLRALASGPSSPCRIIYYRNLQGD